MAELERLKLLFLILLFAFKTLNAEELRFPRRALHISDSINERFGRRSPVVFKGPSDSEFYSYDVDDKLTPRTKREVDAKSNITTKVSIS